MPMMTLGYTMVVLTIVASAVFAVLSRNLLRAAIALGIGSAALAVLFFLMGAPHASAFELSVGAGLISVLFIIAISLTESIGGRDHGP